ncbi:MAG: lysophospholipid acyltransferase family protein, partial [Phycisphaerales bacterium]|nr:lysophospholipid acyltransferase family protein [Phycisphaerales bacterium]
FHHMNRGRRERAEYNIRYSFPDMSDAQVSQLAEQSMRYMFQLFMVDPFVMPRLVTPATWPQYVQFGHVRDVLERMIGQRAAIFITGHVGNWELLGFSLAVLGFPIHAVARPLDNPKLNDWLLGVRESRGMHIITKWGATTILEDLLTHGGQVGFTADQNAGEQGTFVPFFGRLASSYKSISLLAMRFNVPIICGYARRIGQRFSYQIECADIIEPEDWADQDDPLFYVTARYNRAIETMVRQAPDQYLWIHRRWKSRPKHERQGKPVPAKLRQKLESLPWMTQDELDRIVGHSNESAARIAATL